MLHSEQYGISVFSHLLPKPLGNFEQSNLEVFTKKKFLLIPVGPVPHDIDFYSVTLRSCSWLQVHAR